MHTVGSKAHFLPPAVAVRWSWKVDQQDIRTAHSTRPVQIPRPLHRAALTVPQALASSNGRHKFRSPSLEFSYPNRDISTEGINSQCITRSFMDIDYTILGCTTTSTVINVVATIIPSTTSSTSSSSLASLPAWVTNAPKFSSPTPLNTGRITVTAITPTASSSAQPQPSHTGTITAAVMGTLAAVVLVGGGTLFFFLRKGNKRA
jgi:hypothetical protein